jgi:uncharacterized protein (DUF342 family)
MLKMGVNMDARSNGYIQIEVKNGTAICHFHAPKGEGKPMYFSEALEYLNSHGIKQFDEQQFREYLASTKDCSLDLGTYNGYDFTETMYVKVSLDRMKATCRFLPPTVDGNQMNAKDIIAELNRHNIVNGISQDEILKFVEERQYNKEYIFAEGTPPRIGHDARIQYFFNTNPTLRPKHYDDGSVDYRDLNTICHVEKGDLLARLIPEDVGAPGKDIYGRDIPTRSVKGCELQYGQNITTNEDRTELYSAVTGHVSLVNNQVFVSDVFEVVADVDNSVGNIVYSGNVHVKGSVRSGFSIEAKGDVIVDGVVEDALINAGGQIIVKRGIHGMNRGVLQAKGNIIIPFIENAKVFSGGYVETGSIIYSEVNAANDIMVVDRKGFIAGGVIRAGGKVESMIIGSEMGAATRIEVGIAPEKKERYNQLNRLVVADTQKIDRLTPIVDRYNRHISSGQELDAKHSEYLHKILDDLAEAKEELQKYRVEFNGLHQELLNSKHAKIIIRRDIFPGVTITISDLSLTTKTKRSYCQFEKKNGEIIATNL